MNALWGLEGKVALVTGASRGIGRAIALVLADLGCHVAVNYRSQREMAEALVEEIRGKGRRALAVGASVDDEESVRTMFEAVRRELGPVDVLVNNAGITRDGLILRMSSEDWDRVLSNNLRSAFLCAREATKDMVKRRWGRIVNVSSVVGLVGNAGQSNYAASKAGMVGFSKSLALELASRGITVNVVAPGFIQTDMTEAIPQRAREALLSQIPLGRPGSPEDVAWAVAFLCSEMAGYITGQVLAVDGGMTRF